MKKTFCAIPVVHGTGVTWDAGAIAVPTMTSDHNGRCGINYPVQTSFFCFVDQNSLATQCCQLILQQDQTSLSSLYGQR
jgi:hypothetical protein